MKVGKLLRCSAFAVSSVLVLTITGCSAGPSAKTTKNGTDLTAARQVIQRILPGKAKLFVIEPIPAVNNRDVFEVESQNGNVIIRGSSPVAVCSGFNWYLKYYCNCQFSWESSQLNVPDPLPVIPEKFRKESPYRYGYYLNYCTFNYTMSFWDWPRWEKEIDWMAMNGINLPLAAVGTEAVWQKTLEQFHFTDSEIREFICGPGFFAWWLMGNLEGWGGPLPQRWIDNRIQLQKKILSRMRQLGMEPVLPAFYGMVPNKLKEKYPAADIRDQGFWVGGFKRPAFLSPTDPLYAQMARVFYREQEKLFGKNNYFSGDPFHEGGSTQGIALPAAGQQIVSLMKEVSPAAVWVLQGWSGNPKDELIAAIAKDDVLILDLDCDNWPQWRERNAWNGYPWAWCIVHNFGGNVGMFGRLNAAATEPMKVLNRPEGGNLVGIGMLPEGIENNPVVYEFTYEMRWRDSSPNVEQWLNDYAHRRYGQDLPQTRQAWRLLGNSVYNKDFNYQQGTSESILCARPAMRIERVSSWGTSQLYYDPAAVVGAWKLLLDAADTLETVDTYRYDLVDITRQVLANLAQPIHRKMTAAFEAKDKEAFGLWSNRFLELIDDQDKLLATRTDFMLGKWTHAARSLGHTEAEKNLYEFNARTLITTWSFKDSDLHEYSHREWAGLLKDFYKPRWQMFIYGLNARLEGGQEKPINYYAFEEKWTKQTNPYSAKPVGDSVQTAKKLYSKYTPIIEQTTR
ncbi:MAG: alpha-N-acetylglucosaminidase [Planctomycetales bacterium]|nr:alpha-N-acetylglucosaminidase [Planctomycetales bacterium]